MDTHTHTHTHTHTAAVISGLEDREQDSFEPVHVCNLEIKDNHESATVGALHIVSLCEMVSDSMLLELVMYSACGRVGTWHIGEDESAQSCVCRKSSSEACHQHVFVVLHNSLGGTLSNHDHLHVMYTTHTCLFFILKQA